MSYQERQALVSIISTILIPAVYALYAAPGYPAQTEPYSAEIFRFWGQFVVILIAVSIVARIVIQIVFVILSTILTREEVSDRTDERDNLISLKSTRNAMWTFMIGFVLAMGSLIFDTQPSVMFVMLIGFGILSALVSDASELFFYRRGY